MIVNGVQIDDALHLTPLAAESVAETCQRAAAVAVLTLTGAKLLHEGQFEGRKVRLPVFLGRRPAEVIDADLVAFYQKLLKAVDRDVFRNGHWRLCERSGWPDNGSFLNILAWCWAKDNERCLVVVNFSGSASQGMVRAPLDDLRGRTLQLQDALTSEVYDRRGDDLFGPGMYVDLPPWGFHCFTWSQV